MTRALVTGGSGYIGQHLVSALVARGRQVRVLDLRPPTRALPEVLVPELPADPAARPALIRDQPELRRQSLTDADRSRTRSYQTAGMRDRLRGLNAIAEEREFLQPGDRVGFLGIGSGLNCLMLGLEW